MMCHSNSWISAKNNARQTEIELWLRTAHCDFVAASAVSWLTGRMLIYGPFVSSKVLKVDKLRHVSCFCCCTWHMLAKQIVGAVRGCPLWMCLIERCAYAVWSAADDLWNVLKLPCEYISSNIYIWVDSKRFSGNICIY